MTDAELYVLIDGNATAKSFAQAGAWNNCADAVRAVLPSVPQPTRITSIDVYAKLGATVAASVLTKLDTLSAASRAVKDSTSWLIPANGGIDLGHAGTRGMIDYLATVPGGFTAEEAAALKRLAERKPDVSAEDCRRAWTTGRR